MRATKADRLASPAGWLIYRIVDSKHLNATLAEVKTWTLGEIHDAWRRIDFYEEAERREAARQRAKQTRR